MREFKVQVHLVDDVKGIAKTEVVTCEPVRAVAEYVKLYDVEAFPEALPRLQKLREAVLSMVKGNTVVFTQKLLGGGLKLEVAITLHELTKLELAQEALLEAS